MSYAASILAIPLSYRIFTATAKEDFNKTKKQQTNIESKENFKTIGNLTLGTFDQVTNTIFESSGGMLFATYVVLGAVFTAITNGLHTGTLKMDFCGDITEITAASLNVNYQGEINYNSVMISPSGSVLIELNDADNITIDALNTGGKALTISNTSTANGTSTTRLVNDATNNLTTIA
ncbi:MAG: hypothetical protein D6687_01075 [Acidobacteria bacterium]|nr:MAG: hypothetical protein D6687_01075 [Acidobacteriota bacterium]GIU83122.1 MAG: hypothetical protein KatS3mg006_2186 [Pyrinomonadaceae bacterium]